MNYNWAIKNKIDITDSNKLSLVYTPGVGASCLAIKDDVNKSFELTNRANSIAVIGDTKNFHLLRQKSIEYKLEQNIDAYPIALKDTDYAKVAQAIKLMEPSFSGFDLSLVDIETSKLVEAKLIGFNLSVIYSHKNDNPNFVNRSSQMPYQEANYLDNGLDINANSLKLHKDLKGVVEVDIESLPQHEYNNTVAVISDGSAVLGFGNIGPYAALPVMEGKAALLKSLGGVDGIAICLNSQNIDELVDVITNISDSFGGINLEDFNAPRCFEVEKRVISATDIPVFHDDQHGTAVVVSAGFKNALKLVDKDIKNIKVVMSGAGAAAQSVANLLLHNGVENLTLCDIDGTVYRGRKENDTYLEQMAQKTNPDDLRGPLKEVIKGADFFIGLSAPNILTIEMIKSMNSKPVVFALANPTPEIMPDKAKEAGAYIVATGRSDFKNQINNSLAFPGIFRGALDSRAKVINNDMKLAAASAIANLISDEELHPDYIIPHALDERVAPAVANAIKVLF